MTILELITAYLERLCAELGVSPEKAFSEKTGAWYFRQGNTTVEVFITSQNNLQGIPQYFIRAMSPVLEIPKDPVRLFGLYQTALSVNTAYLGFKLCTDENRGLLCIVSERNIQGMEFDVMVTLIHNLGYWADKLNEFFGKEYATK